MSLKERIGPSKVLVPAVKTAATIVGLGIAFGFVGVGGVTMDHHRGKSHNSTEIHPGIGESIDFLMPVYSPDKSVWASVHRGHHRYADSALASFLRIYRAIGWMENNPEKAQGVAIPDTYPYLDPYVEHFSKKDVMEIGRYAETAIKERMGASYKPPENYSIEELQDLLNPTQERYFYPEKPKQKGVYSQEYIEDILLRDPHSPALFPPNDNGVVEVLKHNVGLYRQASHIYRDMPELKPKDLQTGKSVDHQKVRIIGFTKLSLMLSGLVLLARNKYEPKDFLKAVITGTAINTVALGLHLFGGNVTNSGGHAGEAKEGFLNIVGKKRYKPTLYPDGTIAYNLVDQGFLGKAISFLTLDEVGGQREHHEDPGKIAYTSKEGFAGFKEAPWGKFLSVLARSKYFPLINEGKGFNLQPGETRPDMPNPGVLLIQQRRAEQLQKIAA